MKSRSLSGFVLCILPVISTFDGARNVERPAWPKHNYFVRCTRRFTPGLCIEPVQPVWTFVFQLQNCTERYGCPQDWRTNRFSSHARCMRRCKPLVDFYTETLERGPQNLSHIRSQPWNKSGRRYSGDEEHNTNGEDENDTPRIEAHINGPAVLDSSDDREHDLVAMAGVDVDAIASNGVALDDHDCLND